MTTAVRLLPSRQHEPLMRRMQISPWDDPVADPAGFDPRTWYVEQFWLALLGPTSTWLMRRLVTLLDSSPGGFELDSEETARSLGVRGWEGANSPFYRAVQRCVIFGLARRAAPDALSVRRRIPPLPRRHLLRLPSGVQRLHEQWERLPYAAQSLDEQRRRSRMLALDLFEIAEDTEAVEIRLLRWGVHPALAHEASQWGDALCRRARNSSAAPARTTSQARHLVAVKAPSSSS